MYLSVAKQQWNTFLTTFPEIVLVLHEQIARTYKLQLQPTKTLTVFVIDPPDMY